MKPKLILNQSSVQFVQVHNIYINFNNSTKPYPLYVFLFNFKLDVSTIRQLVIWKVTGTKGTLSLKVSTMVSPFLITLKRTHNRVDNSK